MMSDMLKAQIVVIDYTNWRGERCTREIIPLGNMQFTSNQWHDKPQWLFEAVSLPSGEVRWFALSGVHSWKPVI